MSALAVIPARGGSKRVPRKNIRPFLGEPVIARVIRTARSAGVFAEIMVSTDDAEIAGIARAAGAEVPFLRSAATSGDQATTLSVLREVLGDYRTLGRSFETVCCLYPTAVLVRAADLAAGLGALEVDAEAACVMPVVAFEHPVQRGFRIHDGRVGLLSPEHSQTRTQDLEPVYHDAGQWYWLRAAALADDGFRILGAATVPVVQDRLGVQDIDSEQDWRMAELKYQLLEGRRGA